ncbi:major facilitator superfamily domain-containing protein [Penicillium verhagenii]|nr:major facilitator superfamily domain-containing protein [Penicillium verhagenii]
MKQLVIEQIVDVKQERQSLGDCPITDQAENVEIRAEPCLLEAPKKPSFLGLGTSTGLAIFLMPKVWLTLLSRLLFNFHAVTYNTLSRIFLPAPRASPFVHHGAYFGGGLGLTTAQAGLAMSISGLLILPLSLVVYPRISNRLGILRCYLIFLPVGLFLYTVTPFLVFVPNQTVFVWISLVLAMFLKAVSRTFTGPASTIILNNCVSDPSVLATVNGVGSSINSFSSTIGPVLGGWGLGLGLKYNLVGAPWWGLAMVGLAQWLILWKLQYMD